MEETKVTEQVVETTTQEPTQATEPYKVFATEDEYKREMQSLTSKGKFELLKELNAKT